MTDKKKGHPTEGSPKEQFDRDHKPPLVSGQCAEVYRELESNGPTLSFRLTADLAIPEAAARIHDLRGMGFNIKTVILPEVQFRGRTRRNVALYSLGVPSWPSPGFLSEAAHAPLCPPDRGEFKGSLADTDSIEDQPQADTLRQAMVSTWQSREDTTRPQLDLVADEVASTMSRPRRPKAQAGGASSGDPFGDVPGAGDVDWLGA